MNVSFDATTSGIVLPSSGKTVTRAIVLSVGPKATVRPGSVVGVPHNDFPLMTDFDDNSVQWQMWQQSQLHYAADFL